jgi:polyhydroxyalkanoate synthesis repressor PhaR
MSNDGIIELRRYPSRKLYNKSASSYVRLPEVAEMIRSGAAVRVEDTETGEDVTRQVLLQIIMEQENQPDGAMLSANVLTDMIRAHHSRASEVMTTLFEQSVAFMRTQQAQIANQVSSSLAQPWNMFDPAQVQEMQREFQQRLTGFWTGAIPAPRKPEPAAEPANDAAELKALREKLETLEKKLAK